MELSKRLGIGLLCLWQALAFPTSLLGNDCVPRRLAEILSQEAIQDLSAAQGSYKIVGMTGVIGGKRRTIVFAGETHIKGAAAYEQGEAIRKHFKYFGLEGVDATKAVGGRTLVAVMNGVGKLAKLFGKGKGSAITATAYAEMAENALETLAQEFAKLYKEGKFSEEGLEKLVGQTLKVGPIEVSGKSLVDRAREIVGGNGEAPVKKVVTFALEKGHQPKLPEHMATSAIPVCLGAFCTMLIAQHIPHGDPAVYAASGILTFNTVQMTLAKPLLKFFPNSKKLRSFFFMETGLIDGRNETMVNNLISSLEAASDADQVMVVVGSAHVDGMADLLRKKGFQPVAGP